MHITTRLSVEGPDAEGDYAIQISGCGDYGEQRETDWISRAEADALIAALHPWLPIASAPKDESVMVWSVEGWISLATNWDGGCAGWVDYQGRMEPQPRYWMPLPAPPSHDAGPATEGGERQWKRA